MKDKPIEIYPILSTFKEDLYHYFEKLSDDDLEKIRIEIEGYSKSNCWYFAYHSRSLLLKEIQCLQIDRKARKA